MRGREDSILYIDGHFSLEGKIKKIIFSYRFAYMLHMKRFDLSSDMQVPHRCHNRRCIYIDRHASPLEIGLKVEDKGFQYKFSDLQKPLNYTRLIGSNLWTLATSKNCLDMKFFWLIQFQIWSKNYRNQILLEKVEHKGVHHKIIDHQKPTMSDNTGSNLWTLATQ